MCNWSLVINVHMYSCKLFILWGHQTPFVCNFISLFWHNVAFNTVNSSTSVPLEYHNNNQISMIKQYFHPALLLL